MTTSHTERTGQQPDRVAKFITAYQALFEGPMSPTSARFHLDGGLTPDMLPAIAALTAHANNRWTGISHTFLPRGLLLEAVPRLAGSTTSAHILGWLALLAAAPDYATAQATSLALAELVVGTYDQPGRHWKPWAALPVGLGPLAWAAGVSPTEAPDIPVGDLRALAALRGWHWPA